MLVIETEARPVWRRWFAWRPVLCAVRHSPDGEALGPVSRADRKVWRFLRCVDRRPGSGARWEYRIDGRPETVEEHADRMSW